MKKYIVLIFLAMLTIAATKPKPKYLITIQDKRHKTEVYRTDKITEVDSLFKCRVCSKFNPDSLLRDSPYFEIRIDGITFYCERR